MLARTLMYHAYRIAPRPAAALHLHLRRWIQARKLRRAEGAHGSQSAIPADALEQARALAECSRDVPDLERIVDLSFVFGAVAPNQNRREILGLLEKLRELRPRLLCEIGSSLGGNLFLLSRVAHPDARVLSIDLVNDPARVERFRALVMPSQELTCLAGDSHGEEVFEKFRSWIGEARLDFLFIDGDHSYEGVACDQKMYGPYVRPGGIVAFHDIVPDFQTRYGIDTGTYAGDVPEFWAQFGPDQARVTEFVEHRLQDGRGIGVVEIPADPDRAPDPC